MLRATFRSLLARKLRLLLSATAIVLGVSFVGGALTLTGTLGKVFDELFASVNDKTAVEVRGEQAFDAGPQGNQPARAPVPASVLPSLAALPGVAGAVGDVTGYAQLLTKDGEPAGNGQAPVFGVNYDPSPVTSSVTLRSGSAPASAGEVALDATTASETGYGAGDRVTVLLSSGRKDFTVSGVYGFGDNDNLAGASIVAFEQGTAERLLGRPGEFDVVRLAASDGVSDVQLKERVQAALADGLEAVTGQESAEEASGDIKEALSFFTIFLLVFAAVAVFVGAFLIFNTFSMLVAQRQRELALLRALGASRGQVTRSVLLEALVVGTLASVLGLALGVGVAKGLQSLFDKLGGALPSGSLVITATTVVACFVVGVLVTALAALLPARKASKVPPIAAMRDAATPEASLKVTTVVGAVLLALGVAGVAAGLGGEIVLLGLGALLCFLGVAALSPVISRPVVGFLGLPFRRTVPGRLGRLNAMRNPRRTASTAGALMIGLALVSTVSVLGTSVKASIEQVVQGSLASDLVVQQTSGFEGFTPAVRGALEDLPEVGSVDALRFEPAQVAGSTELVTAVQPDAVGRSIALAQVDGEMRLAPGVLLLSKDKAASKDLSVGDTTPVVFGRGVERDYRVGGIYEDNELVGPYLFDDSAAADFTTRLDGVLLVNAADGVSTGALAAAADRSLSAYPTVESLDRETFIADTAGQVDTVLAIVQVLLLLSILIAVLGIVNTLALAVIERTRELGLLRAVGLGRGQTWKMVTVEAVVISVFGALLGIVVGSAFGVAFQRALADEGITVLRLPVATLVAYVVLAAVAGVIAALLPARRAARLDVLQAIATT